MKRIAIFLVCLGLLLVPTVALAQSSTCQSYNPQTCQVTTTTPSTLSSASTLPFTGLDVVLLAAGGAMLLGAGLVVRRLSRRLGE